MSFNDSDVLNGSSPTEAFKQLPLTFFHALKESDWTAKRDGLTF
jgi:hypothetical protein